MPSELAHQRVFRPGSHRRASERSLGALAHSHKMSHWHGAMPRRASPYAPDRGRNRSEDTVAEVEPHHFRFPWKPNGHRGDLPACRADTTEHPSSNLHRGHEWGAQYRKGRETMVNRTTPYGPAPGRATSSCEAPPTRTARADGATPSTLRQFGPNMSSCKR